MMFLAEFYGTWKYYTLMVVAIVALIVVYKVVRSRQT
jgi:hypothetical protein